MLKLKQLNKIKTKYVYSINIILLFLISFIIPFTSWPTSSMISDSDFFKLLDHDDPKLQPIIAAAKDNDIAKAADLWLNYLKNRDWEHYSPLTGSSEYLTEADKALNHTFKSEINQWYTLVGEEKMMFGRPWKDINWHDNPHPTNNEWIWSFNRHSHMYSLAGAYLFNGNEDYAWEYFCEIIDWIENERPVSNPWTWRSIDTSSRMNSWVKTIPVFMNTTYCTGEIILTISKSLVEHARYIKNAHSNNNNWMVVDSQALVLMRSFFPEIVESSKWENEGWETIDDFIREDVYDDGGIKEASTSYHFLSLGRMADCLMLSDFYSSVNAPNNIVESLAKMAYFGLQIHAPDGNINNFGDGDPSSRITTVLSAAPYCTNSELYEQLIYFDSNWQPTDNGNRPQTHVSFPDSGYYITRTNWTSDALHSIMDAAPYGTGHNHHDCLSLQVNAYDRRFLIDPGISSYDGSDVSNHQKSSWGHNMFILDDNPLSGVSAKNALWAAGFYGTSIRGTHDYWGSDATRELVFSPRGYWIINDFWEGEGSHSVDLLYQLPDTDLTEISSNILNTSFDGGANMLFGMLSPWNNIQSIRGGEGTGDQSEFGKISVGTNSGLWYPGRTIVIEGNINGPSCWSTILYPTPQDNTFIPTFTPLELTSGGQTTLFNESFSTPGVAMAVETPEGIDIHISLRSKQTIEITNPNFPNIVFTGTQCIIQFNSMLGVDAVFSSGIDSLVVNSETIITKTSSTISSSIDKFTIRSDSVIPIKVDGVVESNALYEENALTIGGYEL